MRILLANPSYKIKIDDKNEKYFVRAGSRWPFSLVKKISEKPPYIPYPFFIGYTAALLKKQKHKVLILDAVALDLNEKEFIERLISKQPDVMLIETTTPTFNYDLSLVKKIKSINKNIIIVFVGTHASVFPKEVLKTGYIDYVICGEYELVFNELVDKINKGLSLDGIKGLWYIKNGSIIEGGHSDLIYPLDLLLPPDRGVFPDDEEPNINIYWDGFCQYKPAIQMHGSRGCPFRCYFCLWNQVMYNNGKYRTFSVERIVNEIEEVVKKYCPKELYFDDDDFTVRKDYVIKICNEIINRKIKIKWSCMGNIMNIDEEMIEIMYKAGCIGIKFGVESANNKILKQLGKPINLKKVIQNVKLLNKYGIKTHATFIFGLLEETKETMQQTLNLAKILDVDSIQFSICVPYPGTKFFSLLHNKGYIKSTNFEDFDGSNKCIFNYPELGNDEIEDFFCNAFNTWIKHKLLSINWVLRQIKRSFKILLFGNKESRQSLFVIIKRVVERWLLKK